ncbi:hypothetical protein [Amycolatopsis speibonae]|uniref:Uncharacterized protein n=1 Tax=Amycolatopsis speibonae TaxID=1450224 RepID=A0ABV7P091_9PSEU
MPPAMLHHSTGTIFIEDNGFSLGDRADPHSPLYIVGALPTPDATGLLAVATGFVAVTCGVHLGDITVTTEIWDSAPEPDLTSWDDVADVSVTWPTRRIAVCGSEVDNDIPITLPPSPDNNFRVRDSVRDRDAGEDRGPGDPVEQHLIQIWPDDPHPDEILKATDNTGARWRAWGNELPACPR